VCVYIYTLSFLFIIMINFFKLEEFLFCYAFPLLLKLIRYTCTLYKCSVYSFELDQDLWAMTKIRNESAKELFTNNRLVSQHVSLYDTCDMRVARKYLKREREREKETRGEKTWEKRKNKVENKMSSTDKQDQYHLLTQTNVDFLSHAITRRNPRHGERSSVSTRSSLSKWSHKMNKRNANIIDHTDFYELWKHWSWRYLSAGFKTHGTYKNV